LNQAKSILNLDVVEEGEFGQMPDTYHTDKWANMYYSLAIDGLQIDPNNRHYQYAIEKMNQEIETENRKRQGENWEPLRGVFPLRYLQAQYRIASELRDQISARENGIDIDPVVTDYNNHYGHVALFCHERGYPDDWKITCEDPNQRPLKTDQLKEAEKVYKKDAENQLRADIYGRQAESQLGNRGFGQQFGAGQQQQGLPADMSLDEAALTVRNEIVLAKRRVYKTTQYLIQKGDGQHEWQTADICGARNTEGLDLLKEFDSAWIKERKHKYKGLRWVALAVDGAITIGIGAHPPVSMMVEWLDDRPDTLMWRSDILQLCSAERVDRDMHEKLPYSKYTAFEGRKLYIMAATESGLIAGQQKAINRIMKDDNKLMKSLTAPQAFPQLPAPAIFGQPNALDSAQYGAQGLSQFGSGQYAPPPFGQSYAPGSAHGAQGLMQLGPQVPSHYGSPISNQYSVSQIGFQAPGQYGAPMHGIPSNPAQSIQIDSIMAPFKNLMLSLLPQLQQNNTTGLLGAPPPPP